MRAFSVRLAGLVCAVVAMAIAVPVRAQGAPKATRPPPNDPRRGPRLEYTRGPAACLSESSFRDEVAIVLDGVDHFDATSSDVMSVKFEKIAGGFRGTLVYTNVAGQPANPT